MADIISTAEARSYIAKNADTTNDTEIDFARLSAQQAVRRFCGRMFDKDTSATLRKFEASGTVAWVDDFHTTTSLVVATDEDDDGTADETWTTADYELYPSSGLLNGETVPYFRIEAIGRCFSRTRRPILHVTAQWGWATVPASVKQATLMQCAADYARRVSPHGVAAFGDFGPIRARSTMDPRVAELLTPYRHPKLAFGIGG